MHNVEGKVIELLLSRRQSADIGQAAKALIRSCQDILTPALCGGLTVTSATERKRPQRPRCAA